MIVATTRAELKAARDKLPGPVVLVPTMGALHDGHRALLRRAREIAGAAGTVAVSIFVNPLQFGPDEDLDRYPRTLREDLETCAAEHIDLVFAPGVGEMYPRRQLVTVDPGAAGEILEGEFRPGFFQGVLTVVLKLFSLVRPDVAVFGQKDAQQLALVRQMVADFALGIEIEGVPTVRAADGLALSSRNKYLSSAERTVATVLHKALAAGEAAAARGSRAVLDAARRVLAEDGPGGYGGAHAGGQPPMHEVSLDVDYLALVSAGTYELVLSDDFSGPATLAIAARLGTTRLIDNVTIQVGTGRDAADD
jgi:pantoate--beta-alanine ligase